MRGSSYAAGRRGIGRARRVLCAAGAIAALAPGAASAATETVGDTTFHEICGPAIAFVDDAYVLPAGQVTSFMYRTGSDSQFGGTAGKSIDFKVFRALGGGSYEVVGSSGVRTFTRSDGTVETFTLDAPIAVEGGDVLGFWNEFQVLPGCLDDTPSQNGTSKASESANPQDGSVITFPLCCFGHLNLAATVELAPSGLTCFGKPATIYRGSGYPGTDTATANTPMTVTGTPGADVIVTEDGDDVIEGAGGDDAVCGGGGDDRIRGAGGKDQIFGSDGDDDLGGQAGDDDVVGGPDNDRVNGGAGNDHTDGGDGNDIMNGGGGDDEVLGGLNDDVLAGNDGIDDCRGGGGNDRVTVNGGCESYTPSTVSNTAAGDSNDVEGGTGGSFPWRPRLNKGEARK